MSTRDFLIERRNTEFAAFRKVLDALPADQWEFKPHERSPSARSIVWTMTAETKACCDLVRNGHIDWQTGPPPTDPAEIRELHERAYQELTGLLGGMTDEAWTARALFRVNGRTTMEMPAGDFLWFFFFDAIHHRGQLSTYIRPMGGRVPAIYGPSADDPGR